MAENFIINKKIGEYKSSGFDDEIIAVAKKDMTEGVEQAIVDCYMSVKLEKQQRFQMAKALHEGMPIVLGEKIISMDKHQISEVLEHVDRRLPYVLIMAVLKTNPTGKHLQYALDKAEQFCIEKFNGELSAELDEEFHKAISDDQKKDKKDAEASKEDEPEPKPEPEKPKAPAKKEEPISQEMRPNRKRHKKKPKPAQVGGFVDRNPIEVEKPKEKTSEAVIEKPVDNVGEQMLEKFGGIFADIMAQNNAMMERMISASEERTQMILDKVIDQSKAPVITQVVEKEPEPEPVKEIKPEEPELNHEEIKEAEKEDAPFRDRDEARPEETYKRAAAYSEKIQKPISEITPQASEIKTPASYMEADIKQRVRKMPSEVDGVMRMMLMPDGTLYPVYVEKQLPDNRKGVLGMAGRFFGKDSKQNALLSMLIAGGLNNGQMEQIHRAVTLGFPDNEIRDLINSELSADEMKGIVTVIDADRNRNKKRK